MCWKIKLNKMNLLWNKTIGTANRDCHVIVPDNGLSEILQSYFLVKILAVPRQLSY
jgi:hypothetical protein